MMARHSYPILSAIALVCVGAMQVAQALPAIPGASGFGMETPAGRGGTVYRVTNLNESGDGSLAACVNEIGPRVCVFEVSGVIRLGAALKIHNPNLTIAGQTAPSPGVMIRGGPVAVVASDVLIQHIRFRAGDDPSGMSPDNRDSLTQWTAGALVQNIVFDHCSVEWSIDELSNLWDNWDNITFWHNLFAEPLDDSLHPKGPHGYGMVFGGVNPGKISMVGNLLAHAHARNPLSRASGLVFVNNVIYDRAVAGTTLQNNIGVPSNNSIVGNVYLKGPSYTSSLPPIYVSADSPGESQWQSSSRIYQADNISDEPYAGSAVLGHGGAIALSMASTAPVWPAGLKAQSTANNAVYNDVLATAGARPIDRDSVDRRIINSVKTRTGQIINCVAADGSARCSKNGGGWPVYAQNTRALTLPRNPDAVAANGYTNLENWLHDYAAQVEGDVSTEPEAPLNVAVK
jgi:hypothetical protein